MRLYQLFYFTALIAASLNVFGPLGIVAGCMIAGAWLYVYTAEGPKRPRNAFEVVVVAAVIILFSCCMLPAVSTPRYVSRNFQCSNSIKNIAFAMHNYAAVWKQLPPAITYDINGRPMHSWRVLLLPYIEEQALYDKYSFDEPWDGPNNSKLLSQMPRTYRCPYLKDVSRNDFTSSYRVLVGERTCFPPNGTRALDEIRDGLANTLLIVESNRLEPWMAPSDPTTDEFIAELKGWIPRRTPHSHSDLLSNYDCGSCALADGSVWHCFPPADVGWFERLAFIDNGVLTKDELDSFFFRGVDSRIRWEGYLAIAAFLIVAVLPAFWLFRPKRFVG